MKQWGSWTPVCRTDDEDPVGKVFAFQPDLSGHELIAVECDGSTPEGKEADGSWWCDHSASPGAWWMAKVGKKQAGRLLGGRTWDEFPCSDISVHNHGDSDE